ncbi:hypothetical protein MRX96_002303 [Rhipicephalus microplus]
MPKSMDVVEMNVKPIRAEECPHAKEALLGWQCLVLNPEWKLFKREQLPSSELLCLTDRGEDFVQAGRMAIREDFSLATAQAIVGPEMEAVMSSGDRKTGDS